MSDNSTYLLRHVYEMMLSSEERDGFCDRRSTRKITDRHSTNCVWECKGGLCGNPEMSPNLQDHYSGVSLIPLCMQVKF